MGWLEYFTEEVFLFIQKVKEKVLQLSIEKQKRQRKGQIALTDRQMKIIENIQRNEEITSGDVAKTFNISRQAALKELSKLVDLEIIQLRGKGRGSHYVLV